jgi:beta-lactamase class A
MKKNCTLLLIFLLLSSMVGGYAFAVYPFYPDRQFSQRLQDDVRRHIVEWHTNCAVVVKDLSHPGVEYSFAPDKRFAAASIIKVHVLAAALKACKEGKLSLTQPVVISARDITGGSGTIKAMKLPVNLTVAQLLRGMIARSDNTAANKIISLLGFDYINQSCRELGANDTILRRSMMDFSRRRRGVENYTTAKDVVLILEKIYNGTLVNRDYSNFALSLLKEQEVNDRIPKYLPAGTVVAHKTGLEQRVVHDAGIVFSPHGDYIICVMTKDVKNYKKSKNFIALLSRLVYNLYS